MKRTYLIFLPFLLLFAVFLLPFSKKPTAETFSPRGKTVELPVIMYHSLVTSESGAAQYVCPIQRVESDLQWLCENDFESVSLAQLIAFADGEGSLPAKPVLITLDDGYRNNLTLLPPLLVTPQLYELGRPFAGSSLSKVGIGQSFLLFSSSDPSKRQFNHEK